MEQRVPAVQLVVECVVWERVFRALSGDPDFDYVMIDSTIVRAHQHSAGAKGGSRDGSAGPFEWRADHQHPHDG